MLNLQNTYLLGAKRVGNMTETFRNVCNKVEVQDHFRGAAPSRIFLWPKGKENIPSKGVINRYKCDHLGCTVEYIGRTGRTFGDRYKEHLRVPSPIHDHTNTLGHSIKLENFFHHGKGFSRCHQSHKEGHVYQGQ